MQRLTAASREGRSGRGGAFGATVARRERTSTSGASRSWGWGIAVIAKSPITPGPKTRQWVEPPNSPVFSRSRPRATPPAGRAGQAAGEPSERQSPGGSGRARAGRRGRGVGGSRSSRSRRSLLVRRRGGGWSLRTSLSSRDLWLAQARQPGGQVRPRGSLRSDSRQAGADEHERGVEVVGLGDRGHREVADHSWSEDEAVGGASELEVPELLALDDMTSGLDARVDDTGADL